MRECTNALNKVVADREKCLPCIYINLFSLLQKNTQTQTHTYFGYCNKQSFAFLNKMERGNSYVF